MNREMEGRKKKRVVIFASGSGSNAENIYHYFHEREDVEIAAIFTNNPRAGVIDRFHKLGMEVNIFTRSQFQEESFLKQLEGADLIVLAGFLWLVPAYLIQAFPNRIINIHPALLPKYGGKGMHGMHVHEAVYENKEKESGITIHFVNEEYDKGEIILQKKFEILSGEKPSEIAHKVHLLEYEWFPKAIEMVIANRN